MPNIKIKPCKDVNAVTDFRGYTFLMPAVSVGNVGQLSMDLFISTLQPQKYGIFDHGALLPIVGHDPYQEGSESVTTAADLHIVEDKKIVLLQIRSPIIMSLKDEFLDDLTEWMTSMAFASVVILASCHAHMRLDHQLVGSQLRYLNNNKENPNLQQLIEIGPGELEERENEYGVRSRRMAGAGFTYTLLEKCVSPSTALLMFVDEGDNTQDALMLASYANSWLKLVKDNKSWKPPFSWKSLFGPPPPPQIY